MFWLFHVHIHRYPGRPNFCTVLRAVPHEFIGIIIPVDKKITLEIFVRTLSV